MTGTIYNSAGVIGAENDAVGVFLDTPATIKLGADESGTYGYNRRIYIDASRASSTYSGTKLQSAALSVLPCIRY